MRRKAKRTSSSGLTLIELIIAMTIMAILAAAVIPMAEVTVQRTKEIELKRSLRDIRSALDAYKKDFDEAVVKKKITSAVNETGYPEDLQTLLDGKDWGGLYAYKKKYLRRISKDPFDEYEQGWGFRSYSDDYESTIWGGEDIYDVYSQSDKFGLDGTPYNSW